MPAAAGAHDANKWVIGTLDINLGEMPRTLASAKPSARTPTGVNRIAAQPKLAISTLDINQGEMPS